MSDDEADDIRNCVAHAWARDDDEMTAEEFDARAAAGEPADIHVSLRRGMADLAAGRVHRLDYLLEEEDVD